MVRFHLSGACLRPWTLLMNEPADMSRLRTGLEAVSLVKVDELSKELLHYR